MPFGLRSPIAARAGWIFRKRTRAMADLNAVLTRLNDRLLRLEGELFVLRSLARATLTAGDDHAARMRKLVEAARVALDDEARRELDKPTRKYVDAATALVEELLGEPSQGRGPTSRHANMSMRQPRWWKSCWWSRPRRGRCSRS